MGILLQLITQQSKIMPFLLIKHHQKCIAA